MFLDPKTVDYGIKSIDTEALKFFVFILAYESLLRCREAKICRVPRAVKLYHS